MSPPRRLLRPLFSAAVPCTSKIKLERGLCAGASSRLVLHAFFFSPPVASPGVSQGVKDVLVVIYYLLRADYLSQVMDRLKARSDSWQTLEVRSLTPLRTLTGALLHGGPRVFEPVLPGRLLFWCGHLLDDRRDEPP